MTLESGTLTVLTAGGHDHRPLKDSKHIATEQHSHGTVSGLVPTSAEAGIQICFISFCQNTRINLGLITLTLSDPAVFLIVNVAQEGILSRRLITDCHRDNLQIGDYIIQIISSVRTFCHIRGVEASFTVRISGILISFVYDSLISPVPQIMDISGPAHIISHTEYVSVVEIV